VPARLVLDSGWRACGLELGYERVVATDEVTPQVVKRFDADEDRMIGALSPASLSAANIGS